MNLSLEQGSFPTELKLANIIPIFKSGDSDIIGNYRPVSLLTTVSKVFERAFYNRLSAFITQEKILYELQFGFRKGHSTHLAIIKLLESVIDSLDSGTYSAALFLDFSKAFDTVNHAILLDKLNHYGVGESQINGSLVIYTRDNNFAPLTANNVQLPSTHAESLKAQFLGHCCFYFILMT